MATVTYDKASRFYPGSERPAVDALDLKIDDGEFLVLVGPSGSGKSTGLRMLAGLEDVDEGEILIGDRTVTNLAPKDRDIAMVFQSYALYPHMTVYDNLGFSIRLRKAPKADIDRRVKEAAEILDLTHLLDRRPGQLSGGQRQRVALGRAIVREPSVFLMDEPLSNLDAKLRVATRAQIARLHRRLGTTIIYVTHDQVEAMTMGDRIAVMNLGVVQQVGTPGELYERPLNRFVAGFIGSPAMNFLTGTVQVQPASVAVRCGDVSLGLAGPQAEVARVIGDGGEIEIGFRPEHLDIAGGNEGVDFAAFPATVDVVEFLGNDNMLHVTAADHDVVALVSTRHRLAVGDRIRLGVPMERLHLFDPQTGERLTTAAAAAAGRRSSPVEPVVR
ncbi:MAG TPA: sn-glycerol-3-phosphate ABC transporter ATP-binding protein UgpC [Candidatus Dormibacteraeota bacterium]|nr:sn-glycerol-3-phosphate ABC transporter ATP-binding protein UgpC [Candidatus Dormibacteraeota bacterium]